VVQQLAVKDARLKGVADRLGLREIRCRDCFKGRRPDASRCDTCGGSGRLWSGVGSQKLPDSGLRRLA
jgi:hypothetical protein